MSLVPKIVLFGALSRAVNRALDHAFWCFPSCQKPCSRSCFFVLSFAPKIALFFVLPVTATRLLVLIYIYARVCEGRVLCLIVSAASGSFCWIKLLPYALRVFIAQRFLFCFAPFLKRVSLSQGRSDKKAKFQCSHRLFSQRVFLRRLF